MAEPRNPDPNAPENPPQSVVNKSVRRSALWTYLAPLVLFFAGIGIIVAFWATSPPAVDRRDAEVREVEGTTGTEREGNRDGTPGGHNPDRTPSSASDEVEARAGDAISDIDRLFEDGGRGAVGRRVELSRVRVERVESPTLFWIRGGDAHRIAVVASAGSPAVRGGQLLNLAGTVERSGSALRLRASRIEEAR